MEIILIILHVIVSIILISVILLQAGRGGGVSDVFGGSSTQTIFGTSAQQFLMKLTAASAILFIITSLSLAILSSSRSKSLMRSGEAMKAEMEDIMKKTAEDTPAAGAADGAQPFKIDFSEQQTSPGAAEAVNEADTETANEGKPVEQ